jgi:hypothetical protein
MREGRYPENLGPSAHRGRFLSDHRLLGQHQAKGFEAASLSCARQQFSERGLLPAGAEGWRQHRVCRPQTANPIIAPRISGSNEYNSRHATLDVPTRMLIMFASWLAQSVEPNQGEEEPISISFKVLFAESGEKISKPKWASVAGSQGRTSMWRSWGRLPVAPLRAVAVLHSQDLCPGLAELRPAKLPIERETAYGTGCPGGDLEFPAAIAAVRSLYCVPRNWRDARCTTS